MKGKNMALPGIVHRIILGLIPQKASVLDLGCGSGELLQALIQERGVKGHGVELDEEMVMACLKKGLSVIQADIDEGLKEYPDGAYDYVILNQTLQSVYNIEMLLDEMLRVGNRVIVGVPHFANWRIRLSLFFRGVFPAHTQNEWFNTPNIRFITIRDFQNICGCKGIRIVSRYFTARNAQLGVIRGIGPHLFSENALFVLEK